MEENQPYKQLGNQDLYNIFILLNTLRSEQLDHIVMNTEVGPPAWVPDKHASMFLQWP